MVKRATKKRTWTATDVRTFKTLARKLGVMPLVCSRGNKQLRHLAFIQILMNCGIGRRSERAE